MGGAWSRQNFHGGSILIILIVWYQHSFQSQIMSDYEGILGVFSCWTRLSWVDIGFKFIKGSYRVICSWYTGQERHFVSAQTCLLICLHCSLYWLSHQSSWGIQILQSLPQYRWKLWSCEDVKWQYGLWAIKNTSTWRNISKASEFLINRIC